MEKTNIVKYKKNGENFELIVNAEMAYEYVTGKRSDPLSVLEIEEVFKDAKKGERQSEDKISKAFGTTDIAKVSEFILKNSNVPITTEQKAKLIEEKRRQIIEIISKNAIDPRTNAPMPPLRVENAMKEVKVAVDPFKSANAQVDEIVKKLSVLLPIKFAIARIEVTIPPEYSNRCYGILKQYGMKSEQWLPNGSLLAVVEFPAGMQNDFYLRLSNATQGKASTKLLQ
ncbi:MAG: ribosome assembly factor SBDS [Candidatus Micrarchaeaceae archaeon]